MKTLYALTITCLIAFVWTIQSCKNAEPPSITYDQHIKPIFDANCAVSGCHDANTAAGNVNLTTYAAMLDTTYNQILHIHTNGLRDRVIVQKNMPPAGPLPQADLDLIQAWIDQNYLEF